MKNFRKAALALATASTVAFAGTAVASAQDDAALNSDQIQSSVEGSTRLGDVEGVLGSDQDQQDDESTGSSNFFWKIGNEILEPNETVDGTDLFGVGSSEFLFGEENGRDGNPATLFEKLWVGGTYALIAGAIAGVVIGIFNELKFQGILPHTFPF